MLKTFLKKTTVCFLLASIFFGCDCGKDNKAFANQAMMNHSEHHEMTMEKAKQMMQDMKMSEKKDCQMMKEFHKNLKNMHEKHSDNMEHSNSIKGMISEVEGMVKMHCPSEMIE